MYNDGVKLIEARGEGDSPLISLSFGRKIRGVVLVLISLSFCKEKIQIKEANKSPYLLTVFQGAKSK